MFQYLDTASFQNSMSPTQVPLFAAPINVTALNPNIELNSQIQVFNGYFIAKSLKNSIPNFEKKTSLNLNANYMDQFKCFDDLISSEGLTNQQSFQSNNFEENSNQVSQRLQSNISDILVQSENKDFQDEQTQTPKTIEPSIISSNQEEFQHLIQENTQIKQQMIEINKKLDMILVYRQNDHEIIDTLKDNMIYMSQLMKIKQDEFQELQQQHTQLIVQLPMLLNQQNHDQPSRTTLETTKDFINSFMDSRVSQPSNRRNEKEPIMYKEKENKPPQLKKIQKTQDQNSEIFEEFRNICFKKKL